ncbi:hypothetical protein Tco_1341795 [Tanacetum coccineum]
MVFSCGCKAEIWVTKGLMEKTNENVLGMEFFRDQSENTFRVSQSRFYNEKLVHTLLEGHFILTLEGSLLGDCDVEKIVGGHIHMQLEAKSSIRDCGSGNDRSITGYELMIQGCAVSWEMLQHITVLLTIEVVYMALTKAVKETI